jgi:hypothetical protein
MPGAGHEHAHFHPGGWNDGAGVHCHQHWHQEAVKTP